MARPLMEENDSDPVRSASPTIMGVAAPDPPKTVVERDAPPIPETLSTSRKVFLLLVFCLAQFLDAFSNTSVFSAIPTLMSELDIPASQSTWLISAFQLTFASFLLVSGRISDVYNPKSAFAIGAAALGILSIGAGFAKDKISIIVIRALAGIAGSLTIPSSLSLIVHLFPDPIHQSRALGVFGGCGGIGGIIGLVLGAIILDLLSWHWVFWVVAIVAIPISGLSLLLVPAQEKRVREKSGPSKLRSLDLVGVSVLTAALILFIFALTTASTKGWGKAEVLVPLVISILLIAVFFYWETLIPANIAAIPPKTWFYPNFSVLFAAGMLPYFWWGTVFYTFITLWQNTYHWSAISSAVHLVALCIVALPFGMSGPLSSIFPPQYIIVTGQGLVSIATLLLVFADSPERYWSFAFPAFLIGSSGAMLAYVHSNVAMFKSTPPAMAGTVGAIFNCSLQLGSAVGLAIVASIENSVNRNNGNGNPYKGIAAAFWFVFGISITLSIAVLVFYRTPLAQTLDAPEQGDAKSVIDTVEQPSDGKEMV